LPARFLGKAPNRAAPLAVVAAWLKPELETI
jgi:hypothetical protein